MKRRNFLQFLTGTVVAGAVAVKTTVANEVTAALAAHKFIKTGVITHSKYYDEILNKLPPDGEYTVKCVSVREYTSRVNDTCCFIITWKTLDHISWSDPFVVSIYLNKSPYGYEAARRFILNFNLLRKDNTFDLNDMIGREEKMQVSRSSTVINYTIGGYTTRRNIS